MIGIYFKKEDDDDDNLMNAATDDDDDIFLMKAAAPGFITNYMLIMIPHSYALMAVMLLIRNQEKKSYFL